MLDVVIPPLSKATDDALRSLQALVDAKATHAERVQAAKESFKAQNRAGNATFEEIRRALGDACRGARRCMYCEDSAANEIDHFKPKSFYPELTFAWLNYLYACGGCNRSKLDRFKVVSSATGAVVELVRKRGAHDEPEPGTPVLIDPRVDDPLDLMALDLLGTFQFLPRYPAGTPAHERANYTIQVLGLNDRDHLLTARREAYENYRARLTEYAARRMGPQAGQLAAAMMRCGQPTVWAEMRRHAGAIQELKGLFKLAPEALEWVL